MLTIIINLDGLETNYTYSDLDIKAAKNDILDPAQWIADAFTGKVNSCKKRMVKPDSPFVKAILSDPTALVADASIDGWVQAIMQRPDYKDRAARETELKIAEEARLAATRAAKLEAAAINATPPTSV